jgi:hypothetical protein
MALNTTSLSIRTTNNSSFRFSDMDHTWVFGDTVLWVSAVDGTARQMFPINSIEYVKVEHK